jgi:hypothetical protein
MLLFITVHHTLTFGESRWCSITSWGFSLPHTQHLCLLTLPHTHTHKTLLHQKNKFCWGRSSLLRCRKAFLKQTVFLNPDLCVLSSGPAEACRHTILVSCAKHNAQLSEVGLILSLLGEETCEGSFEMFCVCIRHCPGMPWGVEAHFVSRHSLSLLGTCPFASQICNKSVLLCSAVPD